MKLRLLLLVVLLAFPAVERVVPRHAVLVGSMLVLAIPDGAAIPVTGGRVSRT
jgi:hypothetical protein